ncbi:TraB/GumN family protein [Marinospirillum alkaliphilum]|uniref:TraB family protein n=1 Tax=Marinospirillum alkaliphilum DSM 21637 TaxID=1122209 RepID=A0A1K1TX68_9GAMM|nr:TraB/GumN family protein [Marinospirillum alkaliphilum]SFX05174.1 hypothetical protein SAMN02745752_00352 [Marinospirillum alkaliphilum DSM 21637]
MLKRILIILLLLVIPGSLLAESSVWKVQRGNSVVYLAGTLHLLRQQDLPLPEAFDRAYAQSDRLVFEVELQTLTDPAAQQQMMAMMMYRDGTTLRQNLRPEVYQQLNDHLRSVGLPMGQLERFRPQMIILNISMMELQKLGVTQEGVDFIFHRRALRDGKRTAALESLNQQLHYLATMGEGHENELVIQTLDHLHEMPALIDDMIAAWRSGSRDELHQLINASTQAVPGVYETLLVQRNLNWLPQIEAMFGSPHTEMVLVGAGHLVGPDGLLALLERRGYRVSSF